jgi:hypothetical protein
MANLKQILVDETYQIKQAGKAATWAKVVGKTDKRIWVYLYEGNSYIRDPKTGEPKRFLRDPKNIKVSTKRAKGGKVAA